MSTSADPPDDGQVATSETPADKPYRGDPVVWSWVANRITGVLTFFFLFAHVLDTALLRVSPNAYDKVVNLYQNPLVNLLELGLVGAVLYHALNGVRLMLLDFWSRGPRFQRPMLWVVVVVWIAVMIPSAYFLLRYNAAQLFGSD